MVIPAVPIAPIIAGAPLFPATGVMGVILRRLYGRDDSALAASLRFGVVVDDVHDGRLLAENAVIE